jgi:putative ABC transport system ATP-binding protein
MYALRGVERSFRQGDRTVTALAGIDLEIAGGEHVAITGPSGSGKTTLLQLLGALDRPTGGELVLDGEPLSGLGEAGLTALRLRRIGFVFQQFNLIPTLTARGNVEAALDPLGLRTRERRARAAARLEDVGLAERAGHLPSQLSGGEQQRVAIARALANEPSVVLADEPTGNLDRAAADGVAALLESLAGDGGRTVVVVTHDPELAGRAPRVVHLQDGRIVEDGEARRVTGLRAVEVTVGDVERAAAWYEHLLGVPVNGAAVPVGPGTELRLVQGPRRPVTIEIEVAAVTGERERHDPWGNTLRLVPRVE